MVHREGGIPCSFDPKLITPWGVLDGGNRKRAQGNTKKRFMEGIDGQLLDEVSLQAKESPRLRMNYNSH